MSESHRAELSRRALLRATIGTGLASAMAGEAEAATTVTTAVTSGTAVTPVSSGAAGAGAGAGAGPVLAETGSAQMPRIYSRAEWRASPPRRKAKVLRRPPDHIVVHHTVTPNTADTSLAQAFRLSRQVQHHHIRHNKWDDTGQQLTISRGGHVMEGRNQSLAAILGCRHVLGAQTLHHNEHTLGIESEGDYTTQPPPGQLWSSLVRVCAWLCTVYGLDPARALVGHRDYNRTACPGNVLYARLPMLRKAVALAM